MMPLTADLFAGQTPSQELEPGILYYPMYLTGAQQTSLLDDIQRVLAAAPLFRPVMPKTGKLFSVEMSNCGPLGWVSDLAGYRYQPQHPVTGSAWPSIPPALLSLWRDVAGYAYPPEACLINHYEPRAKMGLHQDRDEEDFAAPVVSISLGASCRFRIGGLKRTDPTRSLILASGDVIVMGGVGRLAFHGVDRILPGTSTLQAGDGRINLTLRRVTRPAGHTHPAHGTEKTI